MGEAKLIIQAKVDETEFSFQDKQQPATHFLQTFSSSSSSSHQIDKQISQTSIDINIPYGPTDPDLNLRLSLGGIYNKENPLTRSSSIAGMVSVDREKLPSLALPRSFLSVERSCSLPAKVERSKKVEGNVNVNVKELRIMRRFEAKKRVVEKQKVNGKRSCEEEMLVVDGPPASPSKIPAWAAASAAKSPALNKAIEKIKEGFRKLEGLQNLGTPTSPSNSRPSLQPVKLEPLNTSETETNDEPIKLKPAAEIMSTNQTKKAKLSNSGCIIHNEIEVMKQMPSVTTTGEGPNGRKIEGFLYKYMKGQVIIVCVCHGNFLSAEEFVKHSGRKDVRNPTKHINICSTTFS